MVFLHGGGVQESSMLYLSMYVRNPHCGNVSENCQICGIWYLSDMAQFLFHWTEVKWIFTYFSDRFFQSDFLDVEHQAFGSAIMESSRVEIECVSSWNPIRKQT